jgi:hypothetical protein
MFDKDHCTATSSLRSSFRFPPISPHFIPYSLPRKLETGPLRKHETQIKMPGSPRTSSDLNEKAHQTNVSPLEDEDEFIVDKAMEKTLSWKCDIKLLPPLICLFVITFIDRTNIANAKIEGMATDLKMKGNDYNTSLWILNIPYICLAVPSNLLMKKGFVRPAVYLSGIMFCWGENT